METEDNVQVIVRVRPMTTTERGEEESEVVRVSGNALRLARGGADEREFAFDRAFGAEASQEEVFKTSAQKMVEQFLAGYNCTIFAYGQTGAGKTFTMLGEEGAESQGVLPRSLEYIFFLLQERRGEFIVKLTFVEIYNERVTDLLGDEGARLTLREDIQRGVFVEGVREEQVATVGEARAALRRGLSQRRVGETLANAQSSRSHAVFTVFLQSVQNGEGCSTYRTSAFHFVDLAGSERAKSALTSGERLREGCSINKSLTVLGGVIFALSSGRQRANYVRYRDSKLTFMLKNALGGNSKTVFFANIAPGIAAYSETLGTLLFAQRAKLVHNSARVNEDFRGESAAAVVEELKRAKAELRATQEKLALAERAVLGAPRAEKSAEKSTLLREALGLLRKCLDKWEGQLAGSEENAELCRFLALSASRVKQLVILLKMELFAGAAPSAGLAAELCLLREEAAEDRRALCVLEDRLAQAEELLPAPGGRAERRQNAFLAEQRFERLNAELRAAAEENKRISAENELLEERVQMLKSWNAQTLEDKRVLNENIEKIRYEKFSLMKRLSEEFDCTKNRNEELAAQLDAALRERDAASEALAVERAEARRACEQRRALRDELGALQNVALALEAERARAERFAAEIAAANCANDALRAQIAELQFRGDARERQFDDLKAFFEAHFPRVAELKAAISEAATRGGSRESPRVESRSERATMRLRAENERLREQNRRYFDGIMRLRSAFSENSVSLFDRIAEFALGKSEIDELRQKVAFFGAENNSLKRKIRKLCDRTRRETKALKKLAEKSRIANSLFNRAFELKCAETDFYTQKIFKAENREFAERPIEGETPIKL